MGPDNNQQPPQAGAVPEWFNPVSPIAPPPKSKKTLMRVLIIGGITLLLCLVVAVVVIVTRQTSTCLDASDYKALTGVDTSSSDLSPTQSFYDSYTLFKDGVLTYDDSTDGGQHGNQLIQKIANFYKAHTAKPILITVSASYLTPDNELLTNQRIATVQSSLLAAGVPESVVVVSGASYITPEDAIEGDGDTGEISIAITSDTTCR